PKAIREVSKDLRGATKVDLADGRRLGAAQIQGEFLERLSQYAQTELDLDPWQTQVLNIWRTCLKAISGGDWEKVTHLVDWAAKKKLLQAYANRHQLAPNDVRLKRLALAYHDLDPASGLRTKLERSGALATFIDANKANCPTAPATTRAHLRGSLIEAAQGAGRLVKADWVNIKLEDGSAHQFELLDPLANSDWRVDKLLSELQSSQIDPFWQGTGV
ncbi:MAG: proteasome accessory factor PafA2 family protein, partial [Actinomyces graevenitzii]|nr:proteasome accessory factor PafA2 family protein [Actinomyces graevenitzii]